MNLCGWEASQGPALFGFRSMHNFFEWVLAHGVGGVAAKEHVDYIHVWSTASFFP